MKPELLNDICRLVAWLETRPVRQVSLRENHSSLEIKFRRTKPHNGLANAEVHTLCATGVGVFHHHHPDTGAALPCISAGDFLFPVCASADPADHFLAPDGELVEYGTPLIQQPSQPQRDL